MRTIKVLAIPGLLVACFVLAMIVARGSRAQSCCNLPTSETSDSAGPVIQAPEISFEQTLQSTSNWNGTTVQEVPTPGTTGSNTCWWSNSGLPQHPVVQGSHWTVGIVNNQAAGENEWGYDTIGNNFTTMGIIATQGPKHGIKSGCKYTIYQTMQLFCNSYQNYQNNVLTITTTWNAQGGAQSQDVCRGSECDFY